MEPNTILVKKLTGTRQASLYNVNGILCKGKKETKYIESLVWKDKELPTKPKRISTPLGSYTPDFEFPDHYVEIKGTGTYKVMMGLEAYIKGTPLSDLQWRKIQWVNENVKPIEIIIVPNNYKDLGGIEINPNFNIKILL